MQQTQGGGGRVMNFGKKPKAIDGEGNVRLASKDVAGAEEATRIRRSSRVLKGSRQLQLSVLKFERCIIGRPPGKTLLAKAVAGEAGVPFFTFLV